MTYGLRTLGDAVMTWLVVEETSGAFGSFNLAHVENVSCDGTTWFVQVRGAPPRGFKNPLISTTQTGQLSIRPRRRRPRCGPARKRRKGRSSARPSPEPRHRGLLGPGRGGGGRDRLGSLAAARGGERPPAHDAHRDLEREAGEVLRRRGPTRLMLETTPSWMELPAPWAMAAGQKLPERIVSQARKKEAATSWIGEITRAPSSG